MASPERFDNPFNQSFTHGELDGVFLDQLTARSIEFDSPEIIEEVTRYWEGLPSGDREIISAFAIKRFPGNKEMQEAFTRATILTHASMELRRDMHQTLNELHQVEAVPEEPERTFRPIGPENSMS